jgi:hypothetical protein
MEAIAQLTGDVACLPPHEGRSYGRKSDIHTLILAFEDLLMHAGGKSIKFRLNLDSELWLGISSRCSSNPFC